MQSTGQLCGIQEEISFRTPTQRALASSRIDLSHVVHRPAFEGVQASPSWVPGRRIIACVGSLLGEFRVRASGRRGVLLDTNVWNYISDSGHGSDLDAIARDLDIQWICPPSILLELARRPPSHKAERDRTIRVFARGYRRLRLSADAEYESRELIDAIARHRPGWLRRFPDHESWGFWHQYWSNGVWKTALNHSDRLFAHQPQKEESTFLVEHQEVHRDTIRSGGFPFDSLSSLTTSVRLGGDRREEVSMWRFELMTFFWKELVHKRRWVQFPTLDSTFADWIGCHVDLYGGISNFDEYNEFWLYQVQKDEIPRNWLRWAIHWAQMRQRITAGNPADAQHASFLLDADIFVTADKALIEVLSSLSRQVTARVASVARFNPQPVQDAPKALRTLLEVGVPGGSPGQ